MNILQKGFVLVGNFPSVDGSLGTATSGSILVIDKNGKLVSTYTDGSVQGPWDSALFDKGGKALYFVANGLNGTIVRYDLVVTSTGVTFTHPTVIASGYQHAADGVTFVRSNAYKYDSVELADACIADLTAAGDTRVFHVEALPPGRRRY